MRPSDPAQWTHEAAREGRVRLGYLGIHSCSVSQRTREEHGVSVITVALGLYLQHLPRCILGHYTWMNSDVFHFWNHPNRASARKKSVVHFIHSTYASGTSDSAIPLYMPKGMVRVGMVRATTPWLATVLAASTSFASLTSSLATMRA